MSPQRSKNQGFSQESGSTATSPGMLLAATALTPLPRATFAGLHSCVDRAGWRNRSGRTTDRTTGLVSRDVYERESTASVDTTEGRHPNQQLPHFERDDDDDYNLFKMSQ